MKLDDGFADSIPTCAFLARNNQGLHAISPLGWRRPSLLGWRPPAQDEAFRFRAPEKSGEEDKDEDSSKPGSSVSTGEPEVYQQWSASLVEPSNQPMGASNHLGS